MLSQLTGCGSALPSQIESCAREVLREERLLGSINASKSTIFPTPGKSGSSGTTETLIGVAPQPAIQAQAAIAHFVEIMAL